MTLFTRRSLIDAPRPWWAWALELALIALGGVAVWLWMHEAGYW
jgi:hypothetical protein